MGHMVKVVGLSSQNYDGRMTNNQGQLLVLQQDFGTREGRGGVMVVKGGVGEIKSSGQAEVNLKQHCCYNTTEYQY